MKGKLNNISEWSSLIAKRFLGLLSEDEKKDCDSLLGDKELLLNGEDLIDDEYLKSRLLDDMDFGEQEAFDRFDSMLKRKSRARIYRVVKIAAVFALPIFLAGLAYWITQNKQFDVSAKMSEQIVPGKSKAYITLADGKVIDIEHVSKNTWKQKGTVLSIDSGKIEYKKLENKASDECVSKKTITEELVYNTVNVPRGAEFFLTLADGTKVWINSESKLRYPVRFTENTREVYISGEAFFEVKKDATKPFIVNTSKGKVKVLGTSFNIRDYNNDSNVFTTLVEGSVDLISKKKDKHLLLEPSEQGVFLGNGTISKEKVDVRLFTSWKDGRFIFHKQRLDYIMEVLSRWYDIEVFFLNESQKDILFSGDIKRYEEFDKILEMLELAGNTKFQIKGRGVIVRE